MNKDINVSAPDYVHAYFQLHAEIPESQITPDFETPPTFDMSAEVEDYIAQRQQPWPQALYHGGLFRASTMPHLAAQSAPIASVEDLIIQEMSTLFDRAEER